MPKVKKQIKEDLAPESTFWFFFFFFFLRFIYLLLERGREISMGERYTDQLPLICPHLGTWSEALIRNQTSDGSVCRLELNPLSHTSQRMSPHSEPPDWPMLPSDNYNSDPTDTKAATQGRRSSIHTANCNLVSAKYCINTFDFECQCFVLCLICRYFDFIVEL